MRVQLLSKREIDSAKARDRQQAVAEGLKLTRRVDGLRELQAETEANYEKYRISTLEEIGKQIDAKEAESEALEKGIKTKREELVQLSGPLDKAWMYYVKTEKDEIASLKGDWERRNADIIRQAQENEVIKAKALETIEKFTEGQKENAQTSERITKLLQSAEISASEARNQAAALLQEASNERNAAAKRNESSKVREQNVLLHEQTLKRKEDELEDREMKALAMELLYYSPVKKN